MAIDVSLLRFLQTAEFGPIKLGMSGEELVELLGEPDCRPETVNREDAPNIWLYDPFEFYFDAENGNRLEAIHVDHLDEIATGRHFNVDFWALACGTPLEQAEFRLDQEELDYAVGPCAWNTGDAVELTLNSGVKLSFLLRKEYDEDQLGLYAITLRATRDSEQTGKKISIEIPDKLYDAAREAARRRNISISDLLSDMLEKHADEL